MNRIILFLSLLILPISLWASDHCTDPDKYTVDKRCYVTDKQKAEKPYNAVVWVFGGEGPCSGTIFKENGNLFVYTAKHCVSKSEIPTPANIYLIDGTEKQARIVAKGNREDFVSKEGLEIRNPNGDWAILGLESQDVLPYVNLSQRSMDTNAISIGYGSLKIMSDEEIADFRDDYLSVLQNTRDLAYILENKADYGIMDDGGLNASSNFVSRFMDMNYERFFRDGENLKVAYCKYTQDGKAIGCQGWHGDSGGGLFDSEGNLMAVRTRGVSVIGGVHHASNQGTEGFVKLSEKTE